MNGFNPKTYLIAKSDSAMAVTLALEEIKRQAMAMAEKAVKETVEQRISFLDERIQFVIEQKIAKRQGIDFLSEDEMDEIADLAMKDVMQAIRIPDDGHTPERGKDYFTEEDVEMLAQ